MALPALLPLLVSIVCLALAGGSADARAEDGEQAKLVGLPSPPEVRPPTSSDFLAVSSQSTAARRAMYLPIINRFAIERGLPPSVADAVMRVESAYNAAAIGGVGEIGLMQIRPTTAAMLGFRGTDAQLAVPETNIQYGVTYLAQAWRLAGGDLCRALMKYRAGHGEERMSPLSVEYCRRARLHLAAIGSDLGPTAFADLRPEQIVVPARGTARSTRRLVSTRAFSEGGFIGGGSGGSAGGYLQRPHRTATRRGSSPYPKT